jgi:putative redox protein
MNVRVKWLDHMSFVGESGSGHSVVMDGAPEDGGRNLGVRPMEMVLLGLGGCATFDVVLILKRARQQVEDCQVLIEAERAGEIPKVFTKINIVFQVKGTDLSEKQVAKAVSMSADKYCSVSKMLEHTAVITHSYEIIEDEV